jgi:hypothetical protein
MRCQHTQRQFSIWLRLIAFKIIFKEFFIISMVDQLFLIVLVRGPWYLLFQAS